MNKFFECSVHYLEDDAEKETKKILLVDTMSFTESEANVTHYLKDWDGINDFGIKKMAKVSF